MKIAAYSNTLSSSYSVVNQNSKKDIDPALQSVSDNSTLVFLSGMTIATSTLAVGLAINGAAAICVGAPLISLFLLALSIDDNVSSLDRDLSRRDVRPIPSPHAAYQTAMPMPASYPPSSLAPSATVAASSGSSTTAEGQTSL